ncbi:MAG: hypothetical protein PWQ77_1726 [Kosmotogales bacterium]|nr:hypothetical protein [Kosmotogales bacterium]
MPKSIKNFLATFTTKEYPIISFNGGMIELNSNIIYNSTLNKNEIPKIVEESLKRNFYIQAYHKNKLFVPFNCNKAINYSVHASIDFTVEEDFLNYVTKSNLNKCLIIEDNDVITSLKREYERKYLETEFVISDNEYLDILPKNTNKGLAAEFLCDYLGLNISEMVAIGDNYNDIPMFKKAGLGIAMNNSSEEVKKYADIIAPGNDESGFAYIIDKLLLK